MDYKDKIAGYDSDFFWFRGKNDLIKVLAEAVCRDKRDSKILIVGAGTGEELAALECFGPCHVIDKDSRSLEMINDRLCAEKKVADACNLPYRDDFFDVAVSLDVFEHIENDRLAADEIKRVLKKNGALIFTVPAFPAIMSSHDKALLHLRRYNQKMLGKTLAGFKKKKFYHWNSALFLPLVAMRVFKKYRSKADIDRVYLPRTANRLLYALLSLDNILIKKGLSMPFGMTIAGICFKS